MCLNCGPTFGCEPWCKSHTGVQAPPEVKNDYRHQDGWYRHMTTGTNGGQLDFWECPVCAALVWGGHDLGKAARDKHTEAMHVR